MSALLGASVAGCGTTGPSDLATARPTIGRPTTLPTTIAVDPTLLGVLPAGVGDAPLVALPGSETRIAADPALGDLAERLAVASATSPDRTDWAIAWVIALRPGRFSEALFRDWRDTYDMGACASQGGPAGHAEATLGGRTAYITTCGAVVVHHVRLEAPDRLVAITSAGDRRFGERIVATLRP